jgi:hypothetical protein
MVIEHLQHVRGIVLDHLARKIAALADVMVQR